MTKIIAIANQKGGVGKTTTALSLGAALAKRGKAVLLIDLDPQGSLSSYLGFDGSGLTVYELLMGSLPEECIRYSETEKLDYIPATITLANADMEFVTAMNREMKLRRSLSQEAFERYDYILIDCLPSLGLLTINAFAAANSVLIPVQAQKFAVDGMGSLLGTLRLVQQELNPALKLNGVVCTMKNNTNMSRAVTEKLIEDYGDIVYKTSISHAAEAANSTYRQQSLVSYKNKLGTEYEQLAAELLAREEETEK
ncbi:MAG: AAA family ATPase [Angelakisella sp.]